MCVCMHACVCVHGCVCMRACVCMGVCVHMLETGRGCNYSKIVMCSYCIVIKIPRFTDKFEDVVINSIIFFSKLKFSDPSKRMFLYKTEQQIVHCINLANG